MLRFRKAVLIIHGFTGNLYDNESLMNYLEYNPCFDVFARTLPGHNKDRFSNAKYTDWLKFVDNEIDNLVHHGYHKIYVIGHSMGGILASYVAARHSEVKKIVLINAAFNYINIEQNKQDLLNEHNFDKYSTLWQKALRTSPFILMEFAKIVKKYKDIIKEVNCDTLILRSLDDEIIPYETGDYIYNNLMSKRKYITNLKGCTHIPFLNEPREDICDYIECFFRGGLKWKRTIKKEL